MLKPLIKFLPDNYSSILQSLGLKMLGTSKDYGEKMCYLVDNYLR